MAPGDLIITDSRCKHVSKCYSNNSGETGQWVPKHFHIITPVAAVIHLECICSGRLTLQPMPQNIGSSGRVTAAGSGQSSRTLPSLQASNIRHAPKKLLFTMGTSSKPKKKKKRERRKKKHWKLHVTSKTHYRTKCRQGEREGFIIKTANFL